MPRTKRWGVGPIHQTRNYMSIDDGAAPGSAIEMGVPDLDAYAARLAGAPGAAAA